MTAMPNPAIAEWRMLIDGALVASSSGKTFDNINPSTDAVIGVTADGTVEDFNRAIAAARRAFDESGWSRDAAFRARCLTQLSEAISRHKEEIRPLLVEEVGTPIWLTRDTLFDVPIARLADYARLATEYAYEQPLTELDFRGSVSRRLMRREPIGVVAGILPWNAPWAEQLMKLGPALAAGNVIILKPSPDAPWASTILGRLIVEETDIPPGVVNVITASDNMMGEVLTTHPDVDMIAFTGSIPNGRRVAQMAAPTLKRLLLELGGKSPHIVLPSADVAEEAATAAKMICGNAGQGCVMRSRLLVPRAHYDEAVEAARVAMEGLTVGDPRDATNFMGPLVSRRHRERVQAHVDRAVEQGNRLVTGGGVPPALESGAYFQPTLFADVQPTDWIAQEEVFGPVLAVIAYEDEADALRIANGSIYGLSASVAAATEEEALAFSHGLRSGTVSINGGVWMHLDTPFGGYKQSGIGRQFGVRGFEEYLEIKTIGIRTDKPAQSLAWGDSAPAAEPATV